MKAYPIDKLMVNADVQRGPLTMSDTLAMLDSLWRVVHDSAIMWPMAVRDGRYGLAARLKLSHNRALCVIWRFLN